MKQPIKVVMLPTKNDNISSLVIQKCIKLLPDVNIGELRLTPRMMHSKEYFQEQNLYVTVPGNINEGDRWVYHKERKSVGEITEYDPTINEHNTWDKIIATTDPKLIIKIREEDGFRARSKFLPQLQQSFLTEFVANPDGEFGVEYEEIFNQDVELGTDWGHKSIQKQLKLNQDNTVNIAVEEKMYSREDVIVICHKVKRLLTLETYLDKKVDNWIETNIK